jgi:hypothetical protein
MLGLSDKLILLAAVLDWFLQLLNVLGCLQLLLCACFSFLLLLLWLLLLLLCLQVAWLISCSDWLQQQLEDTACVRCLVQHRPLTSKIAWQQHSSTVTRRQLWGPSPC